MTVTERSTVEVLPVTGFTGAEIRGVDLRSPLSGAEVAAIRSALLRWKVVFFRDQHIDHGQHVAFARQFGPTSITTVVQPRRGPIVAGYPEIFPMLYEYGSQDEDAKPEDKKWHHDGTAYVNPPLGAVFRAVTAHPHGGDTVFANQVAAYEGLPRSLRDFADGLRAVHRLTRRGGFQSDRTNQDIAAHPRSVIHPVVRVHPETGERALFVNRIFTEEIVGFTEQQSRLVLDLLFEETEKPEYSVPFHWEPGSIAFWDNRAVLHRGPNDLRRLGHRKEDRLMYHVALLGDIPAGVDGRPSTPLEGGPGEPYVP